MNDKNFINLPKNIIFVNYKTLQGVKPKSIEKKNYISSNKTKLDSNAHNVIDIKHKLNSKNDINNKKLVTNDSSETNINKTEILGKITSKYLLLKIFDYIKDNNDYILKLFVHSKYFQKKLNLSLYSYQQKYFDKIGLNINMYLSGYNDDKEIYPNYFDKNYLLNKLKKDANNYGINSIVYYVTNYIKKLKESKKGNLNIYIDIFSPFFDLLSKTEDFWEIFTIPINIRFINKNHLEKDYISFFERINKTNINYSLLFNYNEGLDIKYLKEFNIDFSKVRRLTIRPTPASYSSFKTYVSYFDPNFPKLLSTLFSLNGIANNLVYLKIYILYNSRNKIDQNSMLQLNNFKVLEYLELENFDFDSEFILSLPNLKNLSLYNVNNMSLNENENLKNLILYKTKLIKPNQTLIKAPNLEYFELKENGDIYNDIERYNDTFDFSSVKNLKYFIGEMQDFLKLKNVPLENLKLLSNNHMLAIEKEVIKKIISLKTLKELNLVLNEINVNNIEDIEGENNSVNKIYLNLERNRNDCILLNFQNKFPNLSDLTINFSGKNIYDANDSHYSHVNIIENEKCIINNIKLTGVHKDIELFCCNYEKLVKFDFYLANQSNVSENFPLFNENCNIIFKSLNFFRFKVTYLEYQYVNNLCQNLDFMPNLKYFELFCISSYEDDLSKILYEDLNEIIKSKNIDNIKIDIYFDSREIVNNEGKNFNMNIFNRRGIHIYKFKE